MTLDIDYLRQWIGRRETASETVTAALVARFAATFDQDLHEGDDIVPRMLHWCLAQPSVPTSALAIDGHPARGGFLPPVPMPRRMWSGGALTFHSEIRVGEVVTRHSSIEDITIKEGRSGTLCFVTVCHELMCDDRAILSERQEIVYRESEAARSQIVATPKPAPTVPAPEGAHRRVVQPSAPLLFRYSALTFNAHRIHYDTPYSEVDENYPGLIVHGPLQATLLAQLAQSVLGAPPARLSFRSVSPLFDTAEFALNATEREGGLNLWTSYVGGPVAMEARVER